MTNPLISFPTPNSSSAQSGKKASAALYHQSLVRLQQALNQDNGRSGIVTGFRARSSLCHRGRKPMACRQLATVRFATSSADAAPFASTSVSHASSCKACKQEAL